MSTDTPFDACRTAPTSESVTLEFDG